MVISLVKIVMIPDFIVYARINALYEHNIIILNMADGLAQAMNQAGYSVQMH